MIKEHIDEERKVERESERERERKGEGGRESLLSIFCCQ